MSNATPEKQSIKLSDIVFDEVIYPRKDHDPQLVQKYAEVIEQIEESGALISVAKDMKLLDGKHRWLAYRKEFENEDREVTAFVYDVNTPHEQLEISAYLNSSHGYQLSNDDKKATAKSLHAYGMTQEQIASALNVGKAKVSNWLSDIIKDEKKKQKDTAFDMWLACATQEEIAEAVQATQRTVGNWIEDFSNSVSQNQISNFSDFDPPLYNVWTASKKTNTTTHFGNSEQRWTENLLYLYTDPADVVIDPFAGGGATIDVCKRRGRRYSVSDRKPIVEREDEIAQHELVTNSGISLPKAPWKDTKLVFLDPPYWKQAEGEYSDDPTDLANMEYDEFTEKLAGIINDYAKKMYSGSYIALIIQPTQWRAPGRKFHDHVMDMCKAVKLPVDMRYQVPYGTQQCTPQMVNWSKENKTCLVLSREIVVWSV